MNSERKLLRQAAGSTALLGLVVLLAAGCSAASNDLSLTDDRLDDDAGLAESPVESQDASDDHASGAAITTDPGVVPVDLQDLPDPCAELVDSGVGECGTVETTGRRAGISCEIPLLEAPPDPQGIIVAFDCVVVPRVATDGEDQWALSGDGLTIYLYGETCTTMAAKPDLPVQVLLSCPCLCIE